jgi:hypothetical protein
MLDHVSVADSDLARVVAVDHGAASAAVLLAHVRAVGDALGLELLPDPAARRAG